MSLAILNSDIYNKQQRAMLKGNFTTLRSQYAYESFSNSLHAVSFSAAINIFYLKHILIVGELFVLLGKQSDPALCLCNGGSLYSRGDCRDAKKKTMKIICSSILYDSSPFLVKCFSGRI